MISLAHLSVFSTIDLTSGFLSAIIVSGFTTLYFIYRAWKGNKISMVSYSHGLIREPCKFFTFNMRGVKEVLTYIDDVLCHARTNEEHLVILE